MVKRLFAGCLFLLVLGITLIPPRSVGAAPQPPRTPLAFAITQLRNRSTAGLSSACWGNIPIYSVANGRYAVAEIGYGGLANGMLRANATSVGPWELYTICYTGTYYTIQSQANNLYISAELGFGWGWYGLLRARATSVGSWERFNIVLVTNDTVAIQSQANNLYVSAELGYEQPWYGMMRARAPSIGLWELFK